MKTIKVSETTNTQLDWLVAKCEGLILHKDAMLSGIVMEGWHVSGHYMDPNQWIRLGKLRYSSDWSQMGPIIDRERISTDWDTDVWNASMSGVPFYTSGPTPLVAAARCYVMSKLGETVDVPEELC